jgi:hypothetical protein
MNRLSIIGLSIASLAACSGLTPTTHPLFIARPADSVAQNPAAPTLSVEMNNVLLVVPASTGQGCLAGDYVRKGGSIEVHLRNSSGGTSCGAPAGPFVTRIGPLPPGAYDVTVTLDGQPLVRAERAVVS